MVSAFKAFWAGKRFPKLVLLSLVIGAVTFYCQHQLARRQLVANAVSQHNKVYTFYLAAVERARKAPTTGTAAGTGTSTSSQVTVNGSPSTGAASVTASVTASGTEPQTSPDSSPFWDALREVRHQFPFFKVNILLQGTPDGDHERRVLEVLKSRPRDWMVSDEQEGWARSFYVLPTRNTAAFQVVSDVRDEVAAWDSSALVMGAYAFALIFAFGWYWSQKTPDTGSDSARGASQKATPEIAQTVRAVQATAAEIGNVLEDVRGNLVAIEKRGFSAQVDALQGLDDMVAQIRLLAVNGSIEAARSADTYRVFHVLMQEINHLATQSRETLKEVVEAAGPADAGVSELGRRIEHLQSALKTVSVGPVAESGSPAGAPPTYAAGTAVRRVG